MAAYTNDEIEKLLLQYSNMVYRLAFIQMKTKEQAEDILQDVFLKLMQQTNRHESSEHEKAWLIRTTINCCRDYWKSAWFKRRAPMDEITYTANTISPDKSSSTGFITQCVKKLPVKYRQIIHLYYYEEYSLKEISVILQINENTVKTRMVRGRELLKKYLEKEACNYEF